MVFGCDLVAPELASLVSGAVPTFSFSVGNDGIFHLPAVTYMASPFGVSITCPYLDIDLQTFTPVLQGPSTTVTCEFGARGFFHSSIHCPFPVSNFAAGKYTISPAGIVGILPISHPLPYAFEVGSSPTPVVVTLSATGTTTSTITASAPAAPAATTKILQYTTTTTQTHVVPVSQLTASTYTSYVSSCAPQLITSSPYSSSQAITSSSKTSSALAPVRTGPVPSCPDSDRTYYYSPGGSVFLIECYIDRPGYDLPASEGGIIYSTDYASCLDACATNSKCVDVSFVGSACYLKSFVGSPSQSNVVWGGLLAGTYDASHTAITVTPSATVSTPKTLTVTTTMYGSTYNCQCTAVPKAANTPLSCPDSNDKMATGSCGSTYLIECGIDRFDHDIGRQDASSLDACINACDSTSGCVDVSYTGNNCYMKSGLGAPSANAHVWGAKQLTGCKTSSSLKLRLHRKRLVPFMKGKLQKRYKNVGPDFTHIQITTTTTSMSYIQQISTVTVTPDPIGITTITEYGTATTTEVAMKTFYLTSNAIVTSTTCPAAAATESHYYYQW